MMLNGKFVQMAVLFFACLAGVTQGATYEIEKLELLGLPNYEFGNSVSVSGNYAIIGAWDSYENGTHAGAAYIYMKSETQNDPNWYEQVKLLPSDVDGGDRFGCSVSISGDTAVVGASGARVDGYGGYIGAVYVYKRSGTNWIFEGKLFVPDSPTYYGYFGTSVCISGDTIVVGADGHDPDGINNAGAAYIFKRSGIIWTQQGKLVANDAEASDYFGESVSISGDNVIVGARGAGSSGAAYIFKRSGSSWFQINKLLASDAGGGDAFGISVSISGDSAIVGAEGNSENGSYSGAAYIFKESESPNDPNWYEQEKLLASDGNGLERFGNSVIISGDTVVVGSYYDNGGAGSAYIFKRSGTHWTELSQLLASDGASQDYFGFSLGISGNTIAVGAYKAGSGNVGAVYIYEMPPANMVSFAILAEGWQTIYDLPDLVTLSSAWLTSPWP